MSPSRIVLEMIYAPPGRRIPGGEYVNNVTVKMIKKLFG
jgi:hypothetical protein